MTYKGRTVEPAETAASTKKKFGRILCWTCAQKQPKEG
nr:MAG TPA: outer capsid protein sigma-1 attachment protein [Caudoviricetes sp.]